MTFRESLEHGGKEEGDDCDVEDFDGINKTEASSVNRELGRINIFPALVRLCQSLRCQYPKFPHMTA